VTDAGRGAIPFGHTPETCPVKALKSWITAAELTSGPVFRNLYHKQVGESLSPGMVARIIKDYAKRAGLEVSDFAGHSLRAGFVTSAAVGGASSERIADHTGHASIAMVRVYTRRVDAFADHPGQGLL
jgi:site-specific recombinase XerD